MNESDTSAVLVVDDEPQLADLFAVWLGEDWEVRTAYDGESAIEMMDETIDIVLLDRRMPGLSGDEVLNNFREHGYDCPVIMVTAVDPDFDIVEMGFDEYVVKPITKDDLLDTVSSVYSRTEYDDTMQEYFSLVSKRAVLEAEKSASELEDSEEYQLLQRRIDRLRHDADESVAQLQEHDDFAQAFQNLSQEKSS